MECNYERMFSLFNRIMRLSLPIHLAAAAATFAGFNLVKTRLDASYAASGHPVDYATGQTAFSAEKVMGWYAQMQGKGTLEIYHQTQIIDFAFLSMIALIGILLGTLAARFSAAGTWGRKLGLAVAVLAMAGAAMDAAENLVSFAMLAQPEAIPQALAVVYSSFAVVKFACLTTAMLGLVLSLVVGLVARLR